jgi:alkylation response protein AidB-like acyl-CoA dehydrogenase
MSVLEATSPADAASIEAFFGSRAADVDTGQASVRDGLAELGRRGLAEADLSRSIELVSAVAYHDVATGFSAWAHRMTSDYIESSPTDGPARRYLPDLATAETLGATALAAGTAHVLAGVPLPVTFERDGGDVVLSGRIPWASNLIAPFVVVTAAAHAQDRGDAIVVALESGSAGLEPGPHPDLLALNATGSTTVKLDRVRIPAAAAISTDVVGFVRGVLARFLLLQGAFCSGLAHRSLAEAGVNLGPMGDALRSELDLVSEDVARADARSALLVEDERAGYQIADDDLLALRLRWSGLAASAVHLELAATGGRGYLAGSATARRVREAAFLPIQAPTEVLLRWLLSRSA